MDSMISIIMPVYNGAQFLEETLNSVLQQTYSKFELVIVDDGSTDNSSSIIQNNKDERIRYIPNNHDFISSLNKSIRFSTGKYLARMDADDIMLPNRLQTQFDFLEQHPDIDVCGSWAERFGTSKGIIQTDSDHADLIASLLLYNPMIHPTIMMKRTIFDTPSIMYMPGYPCAEDYKLWTNLAINGFRFANIPEVLLNYRCSENQVTSRHGDVMNKSAMIVKLEYARLVMEKIVENEEQFLQFFNQLIVLSNKGLIEVTTTLYTIYHIYIKILKNKIMNNANQ